MPASPRRIGATTSRTRDTLLDCVERMMLGEGYASISYRTLAAKAGVTASLVQYYFPTVDDVFIAAIRRYAERNLAVFGAALESRADPLRALWEFSWEEATSALMIEFMALANHRKSIRSEIAEVAERVRKVQVDALAAMFEDCAPVEVDLSLDALVLLITGVPKFLIL
ncbi:MAG: TetR/AcrR family transcriptional regulator, partial [Aldersonia sp.]|nr:TetR/AcrR family transcriptional regulator [Aldersonia sp.]